jgi:hypothetical protein
MIKNFLDDDNEPTTNRESGPASFIKPSEPAVITLFDSVDETAYPANDPYTLSSAPVESTAETLRRTGLAWSIGVAFVASVGFLMVIGWGADLLFGSSPWGLVIGIVIGAMIGFYQIFRISSQIFKP